MRVLICRLSSLGDVVCCLPAAWEIRRLFPEAEISWAVDPVFAGILECCPAVNHVVRVKPKFAPSSWPTFEHEFDAVLDLQGLSKSAIVAWRAKSQVKLGYHWQREGAQFVTSPVIPDPSSVHIVDQYVDVARALTGALPSSPEIINHQSSIIYSPILSPHPDDLDSVRLKLAQRNVQGPYVLLNPGAGWITKRWPPSHFGVVVDWLWEQGLTPVALGGNAVIDHAAYDEVASASKKDPVKMTGETGVRELVALIAGAKAHIGGDTGSSHLAADLNIPAIGLYSITRPERSCPYGQAHNCLYDPDGLDRISPQAVIERLSAA